MNYGRFFEFDFESSYLQKGIAVFNYRWLKMQDGDADSTPTYPVYLTFTPESFCFNLHFLRPVKGVASSKSAEDFVHYHNTIIEVRLAPNVDVSKGLMESINNAYDAQFPLKGRAKGRSNGELTMNEYLLDIVRNSFDAQDCPFEGYSQLDCFEPETKDCYEMSNGGLTPHLLRKIILDFLYDLEYTNVFKNIAFYDDLAAKLKENFFFNALMNKTRYYYYRTELNAREVVERCLMADDDVEKCDQGLKFYFEQYAKAEHDWVDSILDDRAMKIFHESPWFGETYEELEQVYFAKRTGKWNRKNSERGTKGTIKKVPSISEFSRRDKVLRKIEARKRYLFRINAADDPFKLTVSNLLNLIRKKSHKIIGKEEKTINKAIVEHCDSAKAAANWEVEHYHFKGLWKLWFSDWKTMMCLALVGIILVVVASFLFIGLRENERWQSWRFIVVAVPFMMLLIVGSRMIRRHFRSTWGMGGLALTMPRLLAAVVAAWFTMSMSEDLFKHYVLDTSPHWPVIILLTLITLLFVGYESKLLNPYDKLLNVVASSLMVFLVAYIYSFVVGLMVFDFFGEKMIVQCVEDICGFADCYKDNEIKNIITSIRGGEVLNKAKLIFVFRFSFFASFIGIFLQLMFQGKSVTKMD